ncbi:nucleotidyltransferase domain-containing protein, partial [Acinetobacter baumannii]|uniref:nucleotidyltransferase domain-containing protein n=2 Tax=Acinetobacter baumannii TaxID=470 RepID=UPI001D193020
MSDFIQLEYLQEKLQQLLAESLFAIYLYGSAVDGGLGPESDLDVLVVVTQPLTSALREQLAQELLKISQPVGELQRPLEVTILLKDEIQSGNYPLSSLYTTNFTEPLSYQDSAFLKLPKFP